jgi:hypothetical protein
METSGGETAICPMPGNNRQSGHLAFQNSPSPSAADKYRREPFISLYYWNYLAEPGPDLTGSCCFNEMKYIHSMRGVFSRRIYKNGGIHT